MAVVNIKAEVRDAIADAKRYQRQHIPRAAVRAINDLAKQARTLAAREVQKERNLLIGDIKKNIEIKRAQPHFLSAALVVRGGNVPAKRYKPRQTKKGVTIKMKRGGSRTLIKGGFIVDSLGGHVFQRTGEHHTASKGRYKGKRREKIENVYRAGITSAFIKDKVQDALTKLVQTKFKQRLAYYITRIT